MEYLTLGNLLKIQREEYEAELSLHRAEITQLRAELEQANGRIALRDGECQAKAGIIADLERDLAAERKLSSYLNDVTRRNK